MESVKDLGRRSNRWYVKLPHLGLQDAAATFEGSLVSHPAKILLNLMRTRSGDQTVADHLVGLSEAKLKTLKELGDCRSSIQGQYESSPAVLHKRHSFRSNFPSIKPSPLAFQEQKTRRHVVLQTATLLYCPDQQIRGLAFVGDLVEPLT